MSRVSKLSAELALLPPEQFVPEFSRAIHAQKRDLIAMGLDAEDAQIAAQSLVAAAVMAAKRLEAGSEETMKMSLADMGVSIN